MSIIAAGLGIVSSIFGNKSAKKQAAASRLGFDYLKDNEVMNKAQSYGAGAMESQQDQIAESQGLFGQSKGLLGLRGALLGMGGDQAAADAGFQQYRDSTGYQFRMNEGMGAITGNAAARGMLNSGAAAKDLMRFGQDFGSAEYEKYLGQVDKQIGATGEVMGQSQDLSAQYGTVAQRAIGAAGAVGAAGSSAGAGVASAIKSGDESIMSGIGGLVKGIGSIWGY